MRTKALQNQYRERAELVDFLLDFCTPAILGCQIYEMSLCLPFFLTVLESEITCQKGLYSHSLQFNFRLVDSHRGRSVEVDGTLVGQVDHANHD